MKNKLINVAGIVCILLSLALFGIAGCQSSTTAQIKPPDPAAQLAVVQTAFDAVDTALAIADDAGLIPDEWQDDISEARAAATAAIAQMQTNVQTNPTQFQAAMDDFAAAMGALIKYRNRTATAPATAPAPK